MHRALNMISKDISVFVLNEKAEKKIKQKYRTLNRTYYIRRKGLKSVIEERKLCSVTKRANMLWYDQIMKR